MRIDAALGLVTTHSFGAMGELLMRTVDLAGGAASYQWRYDAMLRPTHYTDPEGEVTQFVHDGLGRMTRVGMPNGFSNHRNYSADGRITSEQISGGSTIKFGYDAAGRLKQMTGAGSAGSQAIADHSYVHDARGHIIMASAGTLVSTRKIDSLGRVLEEVSEGLSHRNSFDDLAGTIDRHWTDGRHEQIETDPMGRPIRLRQLVPGTLAEDIVDLAQYSFAGASQLETRDVFGSLSGVNLLDARKRVQAHVITAGGGTVESQTYRYDALGRTAVAQSALATDIATVTAAAAGASTMSRSYDYDRADGRLQATRNGTATVYTYGPGKVMTSAGAELMGADAEGRRVQDAQNQYEYDVLGRVVRILRADGSAERIRLSYDALGRLHSSQEAGALARRHVYFGASEVEEHAGGALLRQFSPDPFLPLPLAVHQNGASLAPVYDQRLNRVGLTDSAGTVVERYAYAPFGEPQVMAPDASARAASAFDIAPTFSGMRYLPNAGVYHTRNRFADPRHGVFLSPDPMGPLDSANLYAFARQNPADFADLDGDLAFLAGLLIAAAVGAVVAGSFNSARQVIAIKEGSQKDWQRGQFGLAVGMGAVIAPALVVAPELAIPLAAYGVVNGGAEIAHGNYYTGAFDVVTAALPFGFKGVRTGAMGRGSAIGRARGMGPSTPLSTRVGRFQLIGENARHMLPRLRGRHPNMRVAG